ncbi:carboxyl transferase domain-containing protein [uncultured Parvibaculum sp.]|uniref:acetyl-CoA carboxylase family protein n=1 Tax=uncultured Parvibaculum sp. TaxID=291828 RepID=UPI0030DC4CD3|tara:strand:- start:35770 stop:39066 length:3297 start_codon:yes stop_codon:yes gene_type:complete
MSIRKLLIANRGEIAIRIARAAAELGLETVAIFAEDDAASLHVKATDEAHPLKGAGAAAYLDGPAIIALAKATQCDALHPGYGFLSENAGFARACAAAGITFVGPTPEMLDLFGDKPAARALAERCGVPLLPGTNGPTSLEEAQAFFASLGKDAAMMIKAVAGGGGRGMRAVTDAAEIADAFARCQSEAAAAFGRGDVYVERLLRRARHIEIQIVGDGTHVTHLGERECSLQRRNQKLVEIAPSPTLDSATRAALCAAALRLAEAANYKSLGTFEFLLDASAEGAGTFAFMEANPRLQVEHTVTEEVTGIDLVKTQLRLAAGATLAGLGLRQADIPAPRGHAIELRINMETMTADGAAKPAGGTITAFEPPSGPGIRIDSFGYAGYRTSPNYDSLLAKLIAHSPSPDYADAAARAYRALCEFRLEGVATNIAFHRNLLKRPEFVTNDVDTGFVERHAADLARPHDGSHRQLFHGAVTAAAPAAAKAVDAPAGTEAVAAPMQGRVVSIDVAEGALVAEGQQLAVLEAMKMEHVLTAPVGGYVRKLAAKPGDNLFEAEPLLFIEPSADAASQAREAEAEIDPDHIRPDLAEVIERHRIGLDEGRPEAVARRRKRNQRTARENIADLVDEGSFVEYGALALAAQRRRRPMDELIKMSPADGMIAGVGSVNGRDFDEDKARTMVLAYDFTVFAGTQGAMNHKKKDRMLTIAEDWRLPLVLFGEGGGGRPGDTDTAGVAGLDTPSFVKFARLSGEVPLISVVSGRCFAGNAALVGCSDVIIATKDSNIGMGGPAMIEGGGLGVYAPEDIGPIDVQTANGVVDIEVADEAEAVAAAKQYLSYFQGSLPRWEAADQRDLRRLIPENRLRAYDIRTVIHALADKGTVLELRPKFGIGILTCLVRIEGRPMGLIANNPMHLGGAIDAEAGDKAARFMQLCDAFGLPLLSLCDTPGFMVGPEIEQRAQVRHVSRMFVTGAALRVPCFTVVLRKGYGLGAQGMAAGSFHAPFFIVSWPTGEFGGMGLEGAVRLGYRREMEAIEDLDEREAFFQKMVARYYENGKAINMASFLEIDAVIDPKDTRSWIMRGLKSAGPLRERKGRGFIDTW